MITSPTEPGDPPRIRETGVSVWAVYRSMVWDELSDEAVLEKYPALELADLVAVREYATTSIKSRTQDEFTGRPILPREQLRHGAYYKGRCRNATIARWNSEEQCFYHWREKLGRIFVQTIRYPTDELEPWWDVFDVVEELPACRFKIPFDLEAAFVAIETTCLSFTQRCGAAPRNREHLKQITRLVRLPSTRWPGRECIRFDPHIYSRGGTSPCHTLPNGGFTEVYY